MTDFKLHCFAQSGHSYKAALMLSLCEADWEPVFVDFFNGEARSPEYQAMNSMGEAPVLFHGDKKFIQSGVMLDYLSKQFGKLGADTEDERLEILRWTLWENHKLNSFQGIYRFMLNWAPEAARSEDVNKFMRGRALGAMKVLDQHLANREWIAADRPTTADVACAGYLFYPRDEFQWTDAERFTHIEAWQTRMQALPGWKHPYDLMPGHPMPGATV